MRTKLSEIYGANLFAALAKGPRAPGEEELEDAQRQGGARVQASALIPPPENPGDIGGKGSGTTDYAEGEEESGEGPGGAG